MATIRATTSAFRKQLVGKTLPKALDAACKGLADRVEANAPEESGELKGSVHATPAKLKAGKIKAAVVVSSDHALAVEYGTEEMAPEPFFRPAIRSELPKMIAIVTKAR